MIYIFLVILALFFLQSAVFPAFFGVFFKPQLLFAFIFSLLILDYPRKGLVAGFFAGVLVDFLARRPLGFSSLTFVLAGFLGVELRGLLGTNIFLNLVTFVLMDFLSRYIFASFKVPDSFALGIGIDVIFFLLFSVWITPKNLGVFVESQEQLDFYQKM